MEKYQEKLEELLKEVTIHKEIYPIEIPGIDLYMDQITTFFEDRLGHLKRNEEDHILTKTMINNYTKDKILMPPTKKKYSKEHMILLILIYNLKQSLSIRDIQLLFSSFFRNEENKFSLEELYQTFLDMKEHDLSRFNDSLNEGISFIQGKRRENKEEQVDEFELMLITLMLIDQANLHKRLAEKMIDHFFTKDEGKKKKTKK